MAYDEATAERVRKILSGRRAVTERKMMGGLCFMVSGSMCCAVTRHGGILIRVGEEAKEQLLHEPCVVPLQTRGRKVMTSFIHLLPEGYRTEAALRKWVTRGLDFVAALPAKPARRKPMRRAARSKKASA
jgi:TfoX/Sxy family transcriptional regulator of competence genes